MSDDAKEYGKLNRLKLDTPGLLDVGKAIVDIEEFAGKKPENTIIAKRVHVPIGKIELAVSYWKPVYFSAKTEGRLLNGAEATELGNPKLHNPPNPNILIAMCNLMALEALKRMGEFMPTVEDAEHLYKGIDREREIADFWKKTFAPTAFMAEWAWKAALAVMAGAPGASREILDDYREQLA